MSALDYTVEPEVECLEDDVNDAAFVQVIATIGGWDVVEEFVACKMYPLASNFGFSGVTTGTIPVWKIQMPLPLFLIETISTENGCCVLAEVETEVKRILGIFGPKEHDALEMAKLPNGGLLNHVFEQMGAAYAPRLLPRTEAFQVVREKWKAEVSKKPTAKRAKTALSRATLSKTMPPKKIGVVKMVRSKAKLGPQVRQKYNWLLRNRLEYLIFFAY
jgi:hypothetical protein